MIRSRGGDRGFESFSLHQRVRCEPEFSGGHLINARQRCRAGVFPVRSSPSRRRGSLPTNLDVALDAKSSNFRGSAFCCVRSRCVRAISGRRDDCRCVAENQRCDSLQRLHCHRRRRALASNFDPTRFGAKRLEQRRDWRISEGHPAHAVTTCQTERIPLRFPE
jgi:hypothetical protein